MSGNRYGSRHNVCSLVVHLAPGQAQATRAVIAAMPGVEIVAEGDNGRLALTVVDTDQGLAIDQVTAMHRTPGVVAVALVYHAMDDAEATADADGLADAGATAPTCTCSGSGGRCHETTNATIDATI